MSERHIGEYVEIVNPGLWNYQEDPYDAIIVGFTADQVEVVPVSGLDEWDEEEVKEQGVDEFDVVLVPPSFVKPVIIDPFPLPARLPQDESYKFDTSWLFYEPLAIRFIPKAPGLEGDLFLVRTLDCECSASLEVVPDEAAGEEAVTILVNGVPFSFGEWQTVLIGRLDHSMGDASEIDWDTPIIPPGWIPEPFSYDPASHLESECRYYPGGCVGCETPEYRASK